MKSFFTHPLPLALALLLMPAIARPQSLWHDGTSKVMYADKRASSVGDILTIVVQETTTASKDNKSTTTKQTSVDAELATFLYSPGASAFLTKAGQMPAMKFSGKNDFTGGGTVNNNENIIARVAVRVIDVLPNQNLVIEGRRETSFSGEHQTMLLRGVVRLNDVTSANTVFSYNVADASIHIISQGTIADNQRKGWFARLWDKFAPF
jgi:flagellar L-ring protein precursor FlgH